MSACDRRLKKRIAASSEGTVGDSAETKCRVRRRDGRRAGGLPASLRLPAPDGLLGRAEQATGQRDASNDSCQAWPQPTDGLRIRAERDGQPVYAIRAAGRT